MFTYRIITLYGIVRALWLITFRRRNISHCYDTRWRKCHVFTRIRISTVRYSTVSIFRNFRQYTVCVFLFPLTRPNTFLMPYFYRPCDYSLGLYDTFAIYTVSIIELQIICYIIFVWYCSNVLPSQIRIFFFFCV